MKGNTNFLGSLEKYVEVRMWWLSAPLPYLVVTVVTIVILSSIHVRSTSMAGVQSLTEASLRAARVGDYERASELWEQRINEETVLGASSEYEDFIYPERIVWREIERYERINQVYPDHPGIMLPLAELYTQIGESEKASKYLERVRILDPNNEIFSR